MRKIIITAEVGLLPAVVGTKTRPSAEDPRTKTTIHQVVAAEGDMILLLLVVHPALGREMAP